MTRRSVTYNTTEIASFEDNDGTVTRVFEHGDGILECTCRTFARFQLANKPATCKHLDRVFRERLDVRGDRELPGIMELVLDPESEAYVTIKIDPPTEGGSRRVHIIEIDPFLDLGYLCSVWPGEGRGVIMESLVAKFSTYVPPYICNGHGTVRHSTHLYDKLMKLYRPDSPRRLANAWFMYSEVICVNCKRSLTYAQERKADPIPQV